MSGGAESSHQTWPRDLDQLLELVTRASGAAGKREEERRRIACRFVLRKYREGALGAFTLDEL